MAQAFCARWQRRKQAAKTIIEGEKKLECCGFGSALAFTTGQLLTKESFPDERKAAPRAQHSKNNFPRMIVFSFAIRLIR
ncbi:MAG: hypothetical protein AAB401_18550 [Acidobacteriota bacterium]